MHKPCQLNNCLYNTYKMKCITLDFYVHQFEEYDFLILWKLMILANLGLQLLLCKFGMDYASNK